MPAAKAAGPIEKAPEPIEDAPIVEVISVGGYKMQKTVYADGECETEVLEEPMISKAEINATRAVQRRRGR